MRYGIYIVYAIQRDLIKALRKKRPSMVQDLENIVYHHDNAPLNRAASTVLKLALLGFQRTSHPPYSPVLAPQDFAYFPTLKEHLRGGRFEDKDDIMNEVLSLNILIYQRWFPDVLISCVKRQEKCIEHHGCYFKQE